VRRLLIAPWLLAAVTLGAQGGKPSSPAAAPPGQPAALGEALARWQDMRFGMFIHWGPVSLTGLEIGWSRGKPTPVEEYDRLYERFDPKSFDADEWVRIAKAAGMKYIVFTTKHHDGFSMWDTKQSDYNIARSPFHRDVVRELAAACRRAGLMFGVYYSILDWYHPDYPLGSPAGQTRKPAADMDRYTEFVKRQLVELLQDHGPIGLVWFDGEWEEPWTDARGRDLYGFLRRLQPDLIINNRVAKARAGMEGTSAAGQFSGDYDTPEQRVGSFTMTRPWETCMTIGQQWAYKPGEPLKSLEQALRILVGTVGGNGNLLLNVGPMPDGRIDPRQAARLAEMGTWLARNGGAVYGTRGGPFTPGTWGASTRHGNRIYLHVFAWEGETLRLPALPATVRGARLLGGATVRVDQGAGGLVVHVPATSRDPIDTIVELEVDRPAIGLSPIAAGGQPREK
jgi:alpha-L-fucosidase